MLEKFDVGTKVKFIRTPHIVKEGAIGVLLKLGEEGAAKIRWYDADKMLTDTWCCINDLEVYDE